jgi:hypothetical protein
MDDSPAPSKTHVRVPLAPNGQRTLAMEIHKSVIDDFRRHMLSSPGISDGERRMHAEHKVPAGECTASAALFELGRRKGELAPQAAELGAMLDAARGKREKIRQELFKSQNKFGSLVGTIEEVCNLALKSKSAIAAAGPELRALIENVALCIAESKIAIESAGRISLQYGLDQRAQKKLIADSCYDKMSEIADLCAHHVETLNGFYKTLGPKAEALSEGTASGLRVLRHGEKEGIESFLSIVAPEAEKARSSSSERAVIFDVLSKIEKATTRLNSLASSLCKASAWLAKQRKGASEKPPEGMEDSYSRFIEVARETVRQLSNSMSVARDMLDSHDKYAISLAKLDSLLKEQARLEESLSQLPDTTKDEKLLSQMRQELSNIDLLAPAVAAELGRLQDLRRGKEAKSDLHAQNRFSREEWERVKSGGEPAMPRFTYSKGPQTEPAMQDTAEARKQKFVESALSLFESSLNKNALLREQLEATLPELAELYIKGKGSISSRSLFARFPNRTRHEKVLRNDASEYNIVRVGLSSINEYRLLIDVKNPSQPLIYFVGHKDECEAFMKAVSKKLPSIRERALSNDVGGLFAVLMSE